MKLILVFLGLLALGATTSTSSQRFKLELTFIKDLINLLIDPLKKTDPINVNQHKSEILGMHLNATNVYAEGFSNVLTDIYLDVNFPSISCNLLIQLPKSVASVELWETNIPIIYGKGSFGYEIQNAQLLLRIGYKIFSGFEPTVFKPSVESANFTITGVNHNEEVSGHISRALNMLFNDVCNDSRIHAIISEKIDMILNGISIRHSYY